MASEHSRMDKAVEVALTAYVNSRGSYEGEVPASSDDIRAALLASLPVLLGEPVGWMWPQSGYIYSNVDVRLDGADTSKAKPVYSPSLGEGDGR